MRTISEQYSFELLVKLREKHISKYPKSKGIAILLDTSGSMCDNSSKNDDTTMNELLNQHKGVLRQFINGIPLQFGISTFIVKIPEIDIFLYNGLIRPYIGNTEVRADGTTEDVFALDVVINELGYKNVIIITDGAGELPVFTPSYFIKNKFNEYTFNIVAAMNDFDSNKMKIIKKFYDAKVNICTIYLPLTHSIIENEDYPTTLEEIKKLFGKGVDNLTMEERTKYPNYSEAKAYVNKLNHLNSIMFRFFTLGTFGDKGTISVTPKGKKGAATTREAAENSNKFVKKVIENLSSMYFSLENQVQQKESITQSLLSKFK